MLVSVIIPVYNVAPYLAEALDSVINQTHKDLEIIIIEDGSTDGSDAICKEYEKKDNRIRLIHQENKGLSTARNLGLSVMTGEILAFLDSDDKLHPEFIETTLSFMLSEGTDLVICRSVTQCTTGTLIFPEQKYVNIGKLADGVYDRITALRAVAETKISSTAWGRLYKKKLFSNVTFHDGHIYEDGEVALRIINNCEKVYILNQVLHIYRRRPGSITTARLLDSMPDLELSFERIEYFIRCYIPEIFTEKHIRIKRQSQLHRMIYCFVMTSNLKNSNARNELRNRIIDYGVKYGIDRLSIQFKILWRMTYCCPNILTIIYNHPRFLKFVYLGKSCASNLKRRLGKR